MTDQIVATMAGRTTYGVSGSDQGVINGDVVLTAKITNISTSGSTFVACPVAGKIKTIYSAIKNAITAADAALTFELGGVAITDGAITVAFTDSAAGDVDSCTPTALNVITAGQAIECITDGGSTTACPTMLTIVVSPTL
jgi:hypothetical protein